MNKTILWVLIGIVILSIFAFFNFFKEKEQNVPVTKHTEEETPKIERVTLDNVPYKMDFSGADRILVQYEDFSSGSRERLDEREITDPKVIARVIAILNQLPKEGEMMIKIAPGLVSNVIAYKDGVPIANVDFYRTMLKTESTGFYGEASPEVGQLESELYSIITELRQ